MKIVIFTKIPTLNVAYPTGSTGRRFLSRTGKEFKEDIEWETKRQLKKAGYHKFPVYPKGTRVCLNIKSYFLRKGRDRDNPVKFVQDALEGLVYKNDSQVYLGNIEKEDDKKIVTVEKLEFEFFEVDSPNGNT